MSETLNVGDRVEWHGPDRIRGKIVKKLTAPIEIEDHHVAASTEQPQYPVRSDKTGKEAAHHPDALRKVSDDD